jgi:hypothetical protein
VQPSVGERCFIAKVFRSVSEMQHVALEIKDHRVISRAMQRSPGNLILEGFLPPSRSALRSSFGRKIPNLMKEIIKKEQTLSGERDWWRTIAERRVRHI